MRIYRYIRGFWFEVGIALNLHDLWVGVFWRTYPQAIEVFVCVIPAVPFRLYIQDQR